MRRNEMQYKGLKRIKKVAAVILSAALITTELPQTGIAYASETDSYEAQTTDGQEESPTQQEGNTAVNEQEAQEESTEESEIEQETESVMSTEAETESSTETTSTETTELETESTAETTSANPTETETESSTETTSAGTTETETESSTETTSVEPTQTESSTESEGTTETESSTESEGTTETESSTESEGTTTETETEESTETETVTDVMMEMAGTELQKIQVPEVDTSIYTYKGGSGRAYISDSSISYQATVALKPEEDGSYSLKNRDEFIAFLAEPLEYASDEINLECDIDMKGEIVYFDASFNGIFNGNGHSIYNVKIQSGLFRRISGNGTVKNLHISNVSMEQAASTGVITADNGGMISNCVVTGRLKAADSMDRLGGIAGGNTGTIEKCVFSGTISAEDSYSGHVGGIVGLNSAGTIQNCYTTGQIIASSGNIGGIAGKNEEHIKSCANYMEISSNSAAAGIAADNDGRISDCDNYGVISLNGTSTGQVGGIAANNTVSGSIENAFNHGNVNSNTNNAGGIAGCTAGNISNSGNYAKITGISNIGGIAGQNIGSTNKSVITKCFNKGTITGKEGTKAQGIGGILGSSEHKSESVPYTIKIQSCYNTGNLVPDSTTGYTGGIAGILKCGSVSDAYSITSTQENYKYFGMIVGFLGNEGIADCTNVYYPEGGIDLIARREDGIVTDSNAKKTEQELKNLAETLGADFQGDSDNLNEGFPIITGQGAEQKQYPVIYELNGGCLNQYFELVDSGNSVGTAPSDPTRKHAAFDGWYSNQAFTEEYTFTSNVQTPVMVYAKWITYIAVESIVPSSSNMTLQLEEQKKIEVTIIPADAENKDLIWKSDNPSVVEVQQDGTVTAVGVGTANIIVSVNDEETISAVIKVTVTNEEIFVRRRDTDELISPPSSGIIEGFAVNDEIAVEVKFGSNISGNRTIQWSASGSGKVFKFKESDTKDRDRVTLVGVGTGNARLTVVVTDGEITYDPVICDIVVAPQASSISIKMGNDEAADSITYDLYTKKFIATGNKKLDKPTNELTAEVFPKSAGQKVEWKSSRESILKFEDPHSGIAIGNGEGEAEVTASALDGSKVTQKTVVYTRRIVQSFTMEAEALIKDMPLVKENGEIVITSGNGVKLTPVFVPASVSNMGISFNITSGDKNAIKISTNNPESKPDIKTVATITANKVSRSTRLTIKAVSLDAGKAECEIKLVIKPLADSIKLYKDDDLVHYVNGTNIGINPETDKMFFQLTAENFVGDNTDVTQSVTWKSDNTKVAKVDATGDNTCKVTLLSKGNATITATATDGSGVTAIVNVNVSSLASEIVITGSNMVKRGSTIRLKADIYPKSAENQKVNWYSLTEEFATVGKTTGDVTGIAPGIAVIEAVAADGSGIKARHTVHVTDSIKKFDIISLESNLNEKDAILSGKSVGLDPDKNRQTYKLGVKIEPKEACQTVTWKSSNEKVVKVEDGLLTAVGLGNATVTATSTDGSAWKASVKVYVTTLVESVKISGGHYVGRNKTIQLTADVGGKDAANKKVLWKSSDPTIIEVNGNGAVTAINRTGYATITAEAADGSGAKDSHMVFIVGEKDKIDITSYDGLLSIETDKNSKQKFVDDLNMSRRDIYLIEAIVTSTDGDVGYPKSVIWSTSNKDVAIVDPTEIENGRVAQVTFLKAGKVTITAKTADGTGAADTCTFQVENPDPKVEITGPTQVAKGKKIQLSAGSTRVIWRLANPDDKSIATINSKGQVTGKQIGDVEIIAEAYESESDRYDRFTVHVRPAVSKITILADGIEQKNKGTMGVDILSKKIQLSALVEGDDHTHVKWSSNKKSIVTVDENGLIDVQKNGKAVITATATDGSGKKATLTINVSKKITEITPAGVDEVRVGLKKTVQLSVNYKPISATTKKVIWESADPQSVSVNKTTGKVTAKKMIEGYVTVTATPADNGAAPPCTFKIYVENPVGKVEVLQQGSVDYEPILGIELSAKNPTKQLSYRLEDNKKPANELLGQSVTWKSSNPKIATVDENGLVTGLIAGKVTITATACDGSKKSGKVSIYVGKLATELKVMEQKDKTKELRELKLRKGMSYIISPDQISVLPITVTNNTFTFTTSDKKVATVTSKGKITAKKSGEDAVITVSTTDGTNLKWEILVIVR